MCTTEGGWGRVYKREREGLESEGLENPCVNHVCLSSSLPNIIYSILLAHKCVKTPTQGVRFKLQTSGTR